MVWLSLCIYARPPFLFLLTLWLQDGLSAAQRAGLQQLLLEDDGEEWQQAGAASRPGSSGSSMTKPREEQQQRQGSGPAAAITSPRPRPGEVPAMLPPRQARRQLGTAAAAPAQPARGGSATIAAPADTTWSFGDSWDHPATIAASSLATSQAASWAQRAVVQGQQEEDDDDVDSLLAVGGARLGPAEAVGVASVEWRCLCKAAGAGLKKTIVGPTCSLCVACST